MFLYHVKMFTDLLFGQEIQNACLFSHKHILKSSPLSLFVVPAFTNKSITFHKTETFFLFPTFLT